MGFAIFTDTTANIPETILKNKNITALSFPYFIDGVKAEEYSYENYDCKAYYDKIRNGAVVTTSQITPQQYINAWESSDDSEKDILFVGLSSGVSGSYSSAEIAAKQFTEKHPDRRVRTVDTLGASLGEGLCVLKAAELRDGGASLDEAADALLETRKRIYQIFTVDSLMHLKRTGRLSNLSAIAGTVLGIKPLLKGNEHGKIVACEKIRGRKAVIEALAQKYENLVVSPEKQIVGISHCDCAEDAEKLAELIKRKYPPLDILTVAHEPATGSHLGPDSLALYFQGNDDVRHK